MASERSARSVGRSVWMGPLILFVVGVAAVAGGYLYYRHWRERQYVAQCVFMCGTIVKHLKAANDLEQYRSPPLAKIFKDVRPPPGTPIRRDDEGRLLDAWGHPFLIRTDLVEGGTKLKITVISKGPDGKLNTDPDYRHTYTLPLPQAPAAP